MANPTPLRLFAGTYSRQVLVNQVDYPGDQPDRECMEKAHTQAFLNLQSELEGNLGISVGDPRVSVSHDVHSIEARPYEAEKLSRVEKIRTWIVTLQAHVHDAK